MAHKRQKIQKLGPFAKGEKPLALRITFQRSDGSVLDLTGYALPVTNIVDINGIVTGLGGGVNVWVDQANGIAEYQWSVADIASNGVYHLQMWVGNASRRFASDAFEYYVHERTVAPSI